MELEDGLKIIFKERIKFRLSGSGLPWHPARSLRLEERDCFEYAWVMLNRCDRWNKGNHI
jgi:hypothetical protein